MRYISACISVMCVLGCSTLPDTQAITIRYVQMPVLFNYVVQTSPNTSALQKRYNELKVQYDATVEPNEREVIANELNMIAKQMDENKKKILEDIRIAITNVSKKKGYSIVLGGGDTVVYAKEEFDITQEVLKELVALRIHRSPVTR